MNNNQKRFSPEEKRTVERYVLQGVQDGFTAKEIQKLITERAKIEVSYPYVTVLVNQVKTSLKPFEEREPSMRGKRFTDEEKKIIFKYIADAKAKGQGCVNIMRQLESEQGIKISESRICKYIQEYREGLGEDEAYKIAKGGKYSEEQRQRIFDLIATGETGYSLCLKLNKEGIDITPQSVYYYVNKFNKEHPEQKTTSSRRTFVTPAERLYHERANVIRMYKNGFTTKDIAQEYRVPESEVEDFFDKRRYVSPAQYREIIYKSTKGVTPEDLAEEYQLSVETVKKILQNKQNAISSDIEPEEESQQEFDLNVAKNFIKFINTLMTCKGIRTDEADRIDEERQDIFHELEMKDLTQEEKLAMLDRIAELGRIRRREKDYNEIFEPVVEFLSDESNMKFIKTFANKVAEAVNKLKDTSTRVYFMRNTKEQAND